MVTCLSRGIVFIASGSEYLKEAHANALFSKSFAENIPFAIFTDLICDVDDSIFNFKFPIVRPSYSYRDKIGPLANSPFEETLFLDTDACLTYSPDDLFSLLSDFDLCATQAPVRIPPGWVDDQIPSSFHEFNTGVLLLRKTQIIEDFILAWLKLYDQYFLSHRQSWDQATFRSVLFSYIHNYSLSFFTLPSECNLRTTKPWIAGRGSPVYIIHGRFDRHETSPFLDYLNSDIDKFRSFCEWNLLHPQSSIRPRFDRSFS